MKNQLLNSAWNLLRSITLRAFFLIQSKERLWTKALKDLYFNPNVGPVRIRLYLDAPMLDKPYFRHIGGKEGFLRLFAKRPKSQFLRFMGWIYNFAEKTNPSAAKIPEACLDNKGQSWWECLRNLERNYPTSSSQPFYVRDEYLDPKTGMRVDSVWGIRCECEFNHRQLDNLKPLLLKLRELPSGPTESWNSHTMGFVNMNEYLAEVINWAKENKGNWPPSVLHQMAEEKSPITKGVYRPYFANLASRTGQHSANQADILYLLEQPAF